MTKLALFSKINFLQNLPVHDKMGSINFFSVDIVKLSKKNRKALHILQKPAFCSHLKNCNFTHGVLSFFLLTQMSSNSNITQSTKAKLVSF